MQLDTVRTTLSQRLAAFGLKNVRISQLVSSNQPTLVVEVPHFGEDERDTLGVLLEMGQLAFWDTGSTSLQLDTSFDPSQYSSLNPNGPQFTSKDLDPSKIGVSTDPQTGQPQINFEMQGYALKRFGDFTESHIGSYLTLTLDHVVIEAAVIQTAITGPTEINGNFSSQRAMALASVFKYPPLSIALQMGSESSFTM